MAPAPFPAALPALLLALLAASGARAQSCAPANPAGGSWSGSQPGVPSVGCSGCSGSNSAGWTLTCGPGTAVSGSATASCTYSKSCSSNTFLGACLSCNSCGYSASFSGTATCAQCGPGTSKAATDSTTSCPSCAAGTYQPSSGQTSCLTCPPGTYSTGGASACTLCPLGTFSNATGATSAATCAPCASGTFANVTGMTSCLGVACAIGSFGPLQRSAEANATCAPCAPGSYQPLTGQAACSACPVGTAASAPGSPSIASCLPCGQDTYMSGTGAAVCTACPPGAASANLTGSATCLCKSSYYTQAGTAAATLVCPICPSGAVSASNATSCVCGTNWATNAGLGINLKCTCPSGYSVGAGTPLSCNAPAPQPLTPGSVLVVRVGDGAAPLTGALAQLTLEEVSQAGGVLLQTIGTPLAAAGNDVTLGAISRSANGALVSIPGVSGVGPGLPPGPQAPFFGPFSTRAIGLLGATGSVDASTSIPVASYDGIIRGACTVNGSSFYVVGNATLASARGVAWVPYGAAAAVGPTSLISSNTDFSACGAFGGRLLLPRAAAGAPLVGGIFLSSAPASAVGPAAAPLTLSALAGGSLIQAPGMPSYYADSVVVSASGSTIFISDLQSAGPPLPPNPSIWRSQDGGSTFQPFIQGKVVTGVALSPDESLLLFTTPGALFVVSATCSPLPCNSAAQLRAAPSGFEYRGLACSPCGPGTSGAACTACAAGSYAPAAGAATCSPCAAGATTASTGATSASQCYCAANFFASSQSPLACTACGPGSNSSGGNSVTSCTCANPWAVWVAANNTCYLAPSATPSVSSSPSPSLTPSPSMTSTPSATQSATPSHSTTSTASLTATPSTTASLSPTPSPSITASETATPSVTPTASVTPSTTPVPDVLLSFAVAVASSSGLPVTPAMLLGTSPASAARVVAVIAAQFASLLSVLPSQVRVVNFTDVATRAVVPAPAPSGISRRLGVAPVAGSAGVSISIVVDLGKYYNLL